VSTIFERCGGFATVRRIVSDFYDRVLASENLQGYFAGIDMPRLVDHQTKFMTAIMGGPAKFTDQQLERAHARLGVRAGDYAELVGLLVETLEEHGLPAEDVRAVEAALEARRTLIVAR
jgi:hemoglobin